MIALSRAHLRYKLHYGYEKLVIADLNEDLHEVLHITQGLTGIPPDKLKEYKNVFLSAYKEKIGPDSNKDGTKQEDFTAVTTKDCCKKHKEITGLDINTKKYKPRYIDIWLEGSLIEEQKSNIDNKQWIYYPLVEVQDNEITKQREQFEQREEASKADHTTFMISLISRLGRRDNILQHSRIIAPKNLNKIPYMWLELLFSELLRYPDVNQSIGIINKEDRETCLHEFISSYLPDPYVRTISGYAINTTFCNYDENDLDKLQQLNNFAIERCEMLSRPCKRDNRDIIFEILDKDNVNSPSADTTVDDSTPPQSQPESESESELGPYGHLIETEFLSNANRTVYRCKEHPDEIPYYELEGIEESHFKQFHNIGLDPGNVQ